MCFNLKMQGMKEISFLSEQNFFLNLHWLNYLTTESLVHSKLPLPATHRKEEVNSNSNPSCLYLKQTNAKLLLKLTTDERWQVQKFFQVSTFFTDHC